MIGCVRSSVVTRWSPKSWTNGSNSGFLLFLRETRLKPEGRRFTLDEIAVGAGISHGQVGYLLNGERKPGFTVLASLERFFDVSPGFFTATERQALHRALLPVHESLTYVALLKGRGISQIALRSNANKASAWLGQELRLALETALHQPDPAPEDPDVRELADEMLSLPTNSRRRIMPLIRDLLGLVRSEGDSPNADSPPVGPLGTFLNARAE